VRTFQKSTPDGDYNFRGGGAMYRSGDVSWTPITGDRDAAIADLDYDIDAVIDTIDAVLDAAE
jgi:hypothetical protein